MRRWAWLAAAALLLAGCGGGSSSSSGGGETATSGDPVALAAAQTSRAGSVQADFTISGGSVNGTGSGVFDNDAKGSGRVSMSVTSQGTPLRLDTVVVGPIMYMRSAVFQGLGLPPGKEWVRLDLGKLAKQQGVDLESLVSSNPSPRGALAYLSGSSGNVQKLGTEQVQGVDTTHYKATIDLERAARRASGDARKTIRRVISASGLKKLPVETWIDEDGYIRKVSYQEHGSRTQAADITMELHDFGPSVRITSPPPSSVIDFQDLLQNQGG